MPTKMSDGARAILSHTDVGRQVLAKAGSRPMTAAELQQQAVKFAKQQAARTFAEKRNQQAKRPDIVRQTLQSTGTGRAAIAKHAETPGGTDDTDAVFRDSQLELTALADTLTPEQKQMVVDALSKTAGNNGYRMAVTRALDNMTRQQVQRAGQPPAAA